MRILLVSEDIPQHNLGGLAKHVITLARALIKAGHKVDLLGGNQHPLKVAGEDAQFDGQFFGELHWHLAGWKEHTLGTFLPPKRPWIAKKMAQCIMKHAANYDVIHYHGHFPNIAEYIPETINFVQTRHDQGGDCVIHTRFRNGKMCTRIASADCADCISQSPNILQKSISSFSVHNYRLDVAKAYHRHKTIFVSDMLRRNFIRVAGTGDWGVVLHNFVDLEKIQTILAQTPLPTDANSAVLKIFVAGMLYAPKGIEALLQIFEPIMPTYMHLIIAGSGPDEQRLRQNHKSKQITFLGWCDYPTVLNSINASDIVVVPSICEEACATTILEGLALGKPTYALDRGGTPELAGYECYPQQLRLFHNMEELALDLAQLQSKQQSRIYQTFAGDVVNCIEALTKIYQK